jgi:Tol biopolymer transport system component
VQPLSSDGRFAVLEGNGRIFVYDRLDNRLQQVDVAEDGTPSNGVSGNPTLSGDGRYVAFDSDASNLVPGDTNSKRDVFVFDRQTRRIERVSLAGDKTQGNSDSASPSLSADGRIVAFESAATNLVLGDTNEMSDVFVYERQTGLISRISIASDGTQGNDNSYAPYVSGDGRIIVFESHATNLVSGAGGPFNSVFLFDRQRAISNISMWIFYPVELPSVSAIPSTR